jgi:hypothetical protein
MHDYKEVLMRVYSRFETLYEFSFNKKDIKDRTNRMFHSTAIQNAKVLKNQRRLPC